MKIIYNAYVLTPESQRVLMEKIPPKFNNTFYHHMTINFGVQKFPKNLGWGAEITIIGYAEDEKGQAVVVKDILGENRIAHITLSCADGVKPVYSNELLKKGWEKIEPFDLETNIKSFTTKGWIDEPPEEK